MITFLFCFFISLSMPLFVCLHFHRVFPPFSLSFNLHLCFLFSPSLLPASLLFSLSSSILSFFPLFLSHFYNSPSLWPETQCCQKKATELVVSKSSVIPTEYCCMCVYMCVWHSAGHRTGDSSAFLSQLVTQKP